MKTAFPFSEATLDRLNWVRLPAENNREPIPDERPYPVRVARLQLGKRMLRFYQLNDGRRTIDDDDLMEWFSAT